MDAILRAMPPRRPSIRVAMTRVAGLALGLAAGLAVPASAWAQTAPSSAVPAAAASAPAPAPAPAASGAAATVLKPVEITATRPDETQERRLSTAAKIIVGRDEIERYGDSTVGDLLKRLPGVTIQGRPGRGGAIRMRGLGSGYTQILLDGERVAPGFSIDSLAPEQIERIEILRAPTAETGARAIAGTINIITREGFRKRLNDLKLNLAHENGTWRPQVSWTRNDTLGEVIYNYSLTASRQALRNDSVVTTQARDLATEVVTLDQRETSEVRDRRQNIHATGRLQWRGAPGTTLTLIPLLIYGEGSSLRSSRLVQGVGTTPASFETSTGSGDGSFALARLNAVGTRLLADTSRLEWRAGLGQTRSQSHSRRDEFIAGVSSRTLDDAIDNRERSGTLGAKWSRTLADEHNLVAGAEAEAHRRTEQRDTLQNGRPLLADFGENVAAASTRYALYAQDEWNLTPQWAAHAGLRWEGIGTRSDAARNRSSVWTPLLHAVWKPEPEARDQVRFSLTRSYRNPTLQNLIARPSIDNRFPLPGSNTPTQPDRVGNPLLRPELATGLDIAIERYLPGSGLLSANVFRRNISNFLRSQTTLETVPWSALPRWVARTQNVGDATTQGLELEAKFRASEVWPGAPRVDLRANASFYVSKVANVPGPDNRLDQQPSATANLGADYKLASLPLTLGGNLNWTPAYTTRISEVQTAYQGRKLIADAYLLWTVNPALQVRLTASNLGARDDLTYGSLDDAGVRETTTSLAPTYTNLQLRVEIKL